jgi:hypothetical protein
MFKIEDEIHAELQEGDFASFDKALEELKRRAIIPWDEKPNRCPCKSWRTCERKYQIIEYDSATIPWREIQRKDVLSISEKGTEWKNYL